VKEPTIEDLAVLVHRSDGTDMDAYNELERRLQPYIDAWGANVQSTPCGTCSWQFDDIDVFDATVTLRSCCSMEPSGIFKDGDLQVHLDDLLRGSRDD
jgi:hypothetical protein